MLLTLQIIHFFLTVSLVANNTAAGCSDFLRDQGVRTAGLKFLGCKLFQSDHPRRLVARYRIPGRGAKAVENILASKFGMARLVFRCCGWEREKDYGRYRDTAGLTHLIDMFSDETIEKDWKKISGFTVTDELLLDET